MKRSDFLRNTLSLSAGTFVSQIIALATLPLLSRLYSPEQFGILALYLAFIVVLVLPASLKLEQAIMLPKTNRIALHLLFGIGANSLLTAILILIVLWLLEVSTNAGLLTYSFPGWWWAIPAGVFLTSVSQTLRFWQIRKRRYSLVGKAQIYSILVSSVIAILLGFNHFGNDLGPTGLIVGQLFQVFVPCILYLSTYQTDFRVTWNPYIAIRLGYRAIKGYKTLAITLLTSHSLAALYGRIPVFVINYLYGGYALGLYSVADRVVSAPSSLLANAVGDVYREKATSEWQTSRRFDRIFLKSLAFLLCLAIPTYLIAAIFAPKVFPLLFGVEWREAGNLATILLIGGLFSFVMTPIDKGAVIVSAHRYILSWHFARLVFKLLVALITWKFSLSIEMFLYLIIGVRCLLYVYDLKVEYQFSKGALETDRAS